MVLILACFSWEILKEDILKAVNEFAVRGSWPRGQMLPFIMFGSKG